MDCIFCGRPITPTNKRGPKPSYCGRFCAQRAYEIRKRMEELGTKRQIDAWLLGVWNGARFRNQV